MPGPVIAMARRYMTQPTHIRAADPNDEGLTKRDIRQLIYRAHSMNEATSSRVLHSPDAAGPSSSPRPSAPPRKLPRNSSTADSPLQPSTATLARAPASQALRAFRNNKVDVLVATDVAARGINVDDVTHVINYQCVEDEKIYLHRVGRTGRAGNKGTAVTFVDWDDMPRWGLIDKALGLSAWSLLDRTPAPAPLHRSGHPRGHQGQAAQQARPRQREREVLEASARPARRTHAPAVPAVTADAMAAVAATVAATGDVNAFGKSGDSDSSKSKGDSGARTVRAAVVRQKAKQPRLPGAPGRPHGRYGQRRKACKDASHPHAPPQRRSGLQ